MENVEMRGTMRKAKATADTVGSVDKERKKIEREIRNLAAILEGLREPTATMVKRAERTGTTVEAICEARYNLLIERCREAVKGSVTVHELADAAE